MFDKLSYYFPLSMLLKNPGNYPSKCAGQKCEGEREEDATIIDVHSKIIVWSWTFSCDVGYTDPNSYSGSKQRLRCWNSAPQILGFLC